MPEPSKNKEKQQNVTENQKHDGQTKLPENEDNDVIPKTDKLSEDQTVLSENKVPTIKPDGTEDKRIPEEMDAKELSVWYLGRKIQVSGFANGWLEMH